MENILTFDSLEAAEGSKEFKSNKWFRITKRNGIFSLEMVDLGPCVCGQRLIRINTQRT